MDWVIQIWTQQIYYVIAERKYCDYDTKIVKKFKFKKYYRADTYIITKN